MFQQYFSEGEDLNSNQVTEDGTSALSKRNGRDLSAQNNEVGPQYPISEKSQPGMRFILNFLFLSMQLVYTFGIPYLQEIVGVILVIAQP